MVNQSINQSITSVEMIFHAETEPLRFSCDNENIRLRKKVPTRTLTRNLSKAHVTRDSSGPATLVIRVQHAI